MAKVTPRRRKVRKRQGINWILIGGILVVGVIALFALLFTTLQGQGVPTPRVGSTVLQEFCAENEENCVEKGNPEAPVTVVEVSDYACIHCRNFNLEGTTEQLDAQYVETGQVKWIVLPYSTNASTESAAEAAFCAAEQDIFYEYHRAMFARFGMDGAYSPEGIRTAAETAGADMASFESCLENNDTANLLQSNRLAAQSAGVTATPTFFINGRKVEGNQPLANFQQQLNQALETS